MASYKDEIVPAPSGFYALSRKNLDDNNDESHEKCKTLAESLLKYDATPVIAFRPMIEECHGGDGGSKVKQIPIIATNAGSSEGDAAYALIFPNGKVEIGAQRWAILADAIHDHYLTYHSKKASACLWCSDTPNWGSIA